MTFITNGKVQRPNFQGEGEPNFGFRPAIKIFKVNFIGRLTLNQCNMNSQKPKSNSALPLDKSLLPPGGSLPGSMDHLNLRDDPIPNRRC